MSYGMEYGYPTVAARAPADARATFIRRTYGHLAGAILAFAALEAVLVNLPNAKDLVGGMLGSRAAWGMVLLAYMLVGWVAEAWARSATSPTLQYLGLGLYIVAEAVIFLPLLYIANNFYPNTIPTAGILTLSIFAGLTLAVFVTRRDFSYLGPVLSVGGLLLLGYFVAAMIFGFSIGLFFCFAVVALMCGYILYYTSNILFHYRTDQHVAASLALFASVATLFYYIVIILMSRRN